MSSVNQYSKHWQISPDLVFLNHGSFGATPTIVLKLQRQFQDALEADPIAFLAPERELEPKLDAVRAKLAGLLGASFDRLSFVRNATDGVNAVLRSFPWNEGDQIVVTSHGYNACSNAAKFVAEQYGQTAKQLGLTAKQHGLEVLTADVPFPIQSPDEVVRAIDQKLTSRSRLILVDHVTSPTGLVFPIEQIIALARGRGQDIRVLVDGAHAPGMLPLNLDKLAPDYYTANHHKWLCGPKVSGYLYVLPQWQHEVRPTVISHAANRPRPGRSRFWAEFDWTGTFDPSPLLALPAAIDFLGTLYAGGIEELMRENRRKAITGRKMILDRLQIASPSPDEMIGSLATIPLNGARYDRGELERLKGDLYSRYRIELPVFPSIMPDSGDWYLRIALQAYNDLGQIDFLLQALDELLS